ncbi:hypothetical protein V6N12_021115 [Hibiscus sabdariffa]|uniref:Uncharacterized protein n=1 Tax=Hibiscus sabdariffa TaxID=183260 RepID=A0ABR2A928_9ROSI
MVWNIYIRPSYVEDKHKFWENLVSVRNGVSQKWCIIGDFNIVATPDDKCGGSPFDHNNAKWFYDFVDRTYLMEIPRDFNIVATPDDKYGGSPFDHNNAK